jgi:Bacterial extracellular solute-binding proteins, family 3
MVLTSTVTPNRLNYIAYTLGTVPLPSALFGRADVANPVAVTQARFAVERGYAANDTVRRRFPQAVVVPVATSADALRAVLEGNVDYYVGSILETTDTLAREKLQGIELRFAVPIGSGFYHLSVRKDWSRLATILNRGIASLRTTGAPDVGEAVARVLGITGTGIEPLTLAPEATRWLTQTSVLRAGAVRGLALLNDINADGTHTGVAADYLDHVVQRLGARAAHPPRAVSGQDGAARARVSLLGAVPDDFVRARRAHGCAGVLGPGQPARPAHRAGGRAPAAAGDRAALPRNPDGPCCQRQRGDDAGGRRQGRRCAPVTLR